MRKILVFSLVFFFLSLMQTSFFFHFNLYGIVPNTILVLVVLVNFLEKKEKNSGLAIAAIGGFFLDLFSFLPLGISVVLLFIIALLIKRALKFLIEENIVHFVLILFFSFLFYNFFSVLVNSLLNLSFPCFFLWNEIIIIELFYNLLLGTAFYLLVLCSRKISRK